MQTVVASLAAGGLLLALGGCGGGSGHSASASDPAATVKAYLTAVASGDGAGACATLAPRLQQSVLAQASTQKIKASSCADLFGQVKAHMTADQKRLFLGAKPSTAAITGIDSTVSVPGASSRPRLRKQGGRWLITGGIGL